MQWSFPIARVAGSEIRIHLTFFLLLLWIGIAHFQQGGGAAATEGVLFIIAVFACVVLHELGHAIAARRYGIKTPRITLLPIGGIAELEKMPEKPMEEVVVAIAGPLVNVAIAGVLIFVLGAYPDVSTISEIEDPSAGFLARLAVVNIVLVLFNLIPAFPMDGGRVLRALLATHYSRVRATEIAATVGQITSFLFGFLGLSVRQCAADLRRHLRLYRRHLGIAGDQPAGNRLEGFGAQGHDYPLRCARPGLDAGRCGRCACCARRSTSFPVVDGGGNLRGVLTRASMVAALQERGRDAPVHEVMTQPIPVVLETAMLDAAFKVLQSANVPAVGVTDREGQACRLCDDGKYRRTDAGQRSGARRY
jgi:Zn-dependent protease